MGFIPSIYKEEIKQLIESLVMNAVPSGFIGWFKRTEAPEGWIVCDGTNGTPNLIGRYPLGSESDIGSLVDAGLPDISGTFLAESTYSHTTGAFTDTESDGTGNGMTDSSYDNIIRFKASTGTVSSVAEDGTITYMAQEESPYGKSTTVTPPSVKLLPCMKL